MDDRFFFQALGDNRYKNECDRLKYRIARPLRKLLDRIVANALPLLRCSQCNNLAMPVTLGSSVNCAAGALISDTAWLPNRN